jgi:hypothetical protein
MYSGSPAALKRLETLGANGLKENGLKISKALKGKVSVINIKNMMKLRNVSKDDYDKCWYLLGQTAAFLKVYVWEDKWYLSLSEIQKQSKIERHKLVKIDIDYVYNNFSEVEQKIQK